MKLLKTVLVDDEKHNNETLRLELERHCPQVEVIAAFNHPNQALDFVNSEKEIDLIFLDIEMPGMSGFDFIDGMISQQVHIIFVTAYEQFALEAFRVNAIDYLLKPVLSERLIEAVEKVQSKSTYIDYKHFTKMMADLSSRDSDEKIVLPTAGGYEILRAADIIHCKSDNNYTNIYTRNNERLFLSKSLKTIESLLPQHAFLRVHQSHLVNINYIKRYLREDGGYLILSNNEEIPVSKSKKDVVLDLMKSGRF